MGPACWWACEQPRLDRGATRGCPQNRRLPKNRRRQVPPLSCTSAIGIAPLGHDRMPLGAPHHLALGGPPPPLGVATACAPPPAARALCLLAPRVSAVRHCGGPPWRARGRVPCVPVKHRRRASSACLAHAVSGAPLVRRYRRAWAWVAVRCRCGIDEDDACGVVASSCAQGRHWCCGLKSLPPASKD